MEDKIKNAIHAFLSRLNVSIEDISIVDTPAHPLYTIKTSDSKLLIGPQGEHLRALNSIIKRMLERELGENMPHFLIDVNDYHKKRIDEIIQKARLLADRVRTFKSSVEMSPMNGYERMIVHAAFAQDPDVRTESEGEGKFRRVVLKYRHSSFS